MSLIRTLWQCTFSPRLYKFYEVSWVGRLIDVGIAPSNLMAQVLLHGRTWAVVVLLGYVHELIITFNRIFIVNLQKPYEAKSLEKWGDQVVFSIVTAWSLTIYAIPIIVIALFRRGTPLADAYTISQFLTGAGIVLMTSLVARGYARAKNPTYLRFMKVLDDARSHHTSETRQELGKYDFEFWAWPVDFDVSSLEKTGLKPKLTLQTLDSTSRTMSTRSRDSILAVPCKLLSYGVAHTVALRLIYPGSVSLVSWAMSGILMQGRVDLVKIGAERFKLSTSDKNQVDAIFLDRRHKTSNGATLVITCEGNFGFYEVGIITTPLNKGYSVLGWNHPGFGGSTGAPYPDQEENAIDCVMKFAIHQLGFAENRIILNGWSIGGYTASWAAMNYPSIHSLLLDATFDDILPLALARMPMSVEPLVRSVIRNHFNLNVAAQLNRYDGRVLLIRRIDDEMICVPDNVLAGNRGNKLLEKLLVRRYPHLFSNSTDSFTNLSNFLAASTFAARRLIMDEIELDQGHCIDLIAADIVDNNNTAKYPSTLGRDCDSRTKQQLALYLASVYMEDQNTQHCAPLASELFHSGWDPLSTLKDKY